MPDAAFSWTCRRWFWFTKHERDARPSPNFEFSSNQASAESACLSIQHCQSSRQSPEDAMGWYSRYLLGSEVHSYEGLVTLQSWVRSLRFFEIAVCHTDHWLKGARLAPKNSNCSRKRADLKIYQMTAQRGACYWQSCPLHGPPSSVLLMLYNQAMGWCRAPPFCQNCNCNLLPFQVDRQK